MTPHVSPMQGDEIPTTQWLSQGLGLDRATKLALALGDFWYWGAGPTYRLLQIALDEAGVSVSDDVSGKRNIVEAAIRQEAEDETLLFRLVSSLLDILAQDSELDADPEVEGRDARLSQLRRALANYGCDFTSEGRLTGNSAPSVAVERSDTYAATRDHIDRLRRLADDGDFSAIVGSAKDLIESTAKIVLKSRGVEFTAGTRFPRLTADAEKSLQLHASQHRGSGGVNVLAQTMLGNLSKLATAVNDFRKEAGTGHGRERVVSALGRRHAKLVAGASIVYCEMLLDTLSDPEAPWRQLEVDA